MLMILSRSSPCDPEARGYGEGVRKRQADPETAEPLLAQLNMEMLEPPAS
jgi:hypothetical protein